MTDDPREQDLRLLEAVYGAGTMEDDPDWVDDMLRAMADDPKYRAHLATDAERARDARRERAKRPPPVS